MTRSIQVAVSILLLGTPLTAQSQDESDHWSFRKPVRPAVSKTASLMYGNRVRTQIDAFVFQRLEREQLKPAPRADRNTLVRRAYLDLIGLPPSPEQLDRFLNDTSQDAWLKLIDELLRSKHYGERWGRHWLDVARYADSGGFEGDIYYRNAWRYRDYVVKSFNDDKPYDQFVQEQIAADEIWPDNLDLDPKRVYRVTDEQKAHLEARIGTGLYTFGPEIHESALDARRLKHERMTDWIDTTGSVFLGLTLGCARCHEHKFDPITQEEYYSMQAIFAGAKQAEITLFTPMEVNDWRGFYPRVVAVEEARAAYKKFQQRTGGRKKTLEEEQEGRQLLQAIGQRVMELPEKAGSVPSTPFGELMQPPTASVLEREHPYFVRPVHLLERGELYQIGEKQEPGLPHVLAKATGRGEAVRGPYGSRRELALWLTQADHPLTARVMVNRIWQWHFGRGLVATPNDFGKHGQRPSHPNLLDWLATEFVRQGWSVKKIHRLIMRSSVYQMASRFGPESHLQRDPENRLLWRMNRRRLEAEALWDSVHSVAGTINLKMGGRPVVPSLAEDEIAALREKWHWPVSGDPAEHTRRGLYILVRRNFRFPMFEVFDAPVNSVSCPEREVTTVATQALWTLNSPSAAKQAAHFAERVRKATGPDQDGQVAMAWKLALARQPSARERNEAVDLMNAFQEQGQQQASATDAKSSDALAKLCLAIFNLNEFTFVD